MPSGPDVDEEFNAFHQIAWKIAANWVGPSEERHDKLERAAMRIAEALEGQNPIFATAAACMWLDYHIGAGRRRGAWRHDEVVELMKPRERNASEMPL